MSQGPIIKPGRWREPKSADPESPILAEPSAPVSTVVPSQETVQASPGASSLILLSSVGIVLGLGLVFFIYFLIDDSRPPTPDHVEEVSTIATNETTIDPQPAQNSQLRIDVDIDNLSKLWFSLSLVSDQVTVLRRNIAIAEADKQSQTYQALMFALETKLKEQFVAKKAVAQQLQQIASIPLENPETLQHYFQAAIDSANAKYQPDLVIWLEQSRNSLNSAKTSIPSLDIFMGVTHQLFPTAD